MLAVPDVWEGTRRVLVAGRGPADATFQRAVIDSRQAGPGDLFFALHGEHHDGHDFVGEALARGAAGAVVERPLGTPEGAALFSLYCTQCHATRVPRATDLPAARAAIALGGAHEDMPVWGEILTDEQVDALVEYVLTATKLPDLGEAERLFLQNCSSCHGNLGEGGANPGRSGDIIAPISTAEYLATRDDATLRAIISQGQPNFGMSPFADTFGGPLNSEQVDLLVAYLRAWEDSPPVELPPDVPSVPGKDPHPQSDGIRVVFTETLRSSMWKRPWIVPLEGGPE